MQQTDERNTVELTDTAARTAELSPTVFRLQPAQISSKKNIPYLRTEGTQREKLRTPQEAREGARQHPRGKLNPPPSLCGWEEWQRGERKSAPTRQPRRAGFASKPGQWQEPRWVSRSGRVMELRRGGNGEDGSCQHRRLGVGGRSGKRKFQRIRQQPKRSTDHGVTGPLRRSQQDPWAWPVNP